MGRSCERNKQVFVHKRVLEVATGPSSSLPTALVGPNQFLGCPVTSWLECSFIKCTHLRLFCCQLGQIPLTRPETCDPIFAPCLCRSCLPACMESYSVVPGVLAMAEQLNRTLCLPTNQSCLDCTLGLVAAAESRAAYVVFVGISTTTPMGDPIWAKTLKLCFHVRLARSASASAIST